MDYLATRKLIKPGTRFDLVGNKLVLIAPRDSKLTATIASGFPLASLLGDGHLAMADTASVPAGKYGKAALEKIRRDGVKRKSVGVEIAGDPIPFNPVKWTAKADGKAVGRITSAVWSPRLKKNIGYAMLPTAHTKIGTNLIVDVPGVGDRQATVVAKPFVDPDQAIPKT